MSATQGTSGFGTLLQRGDGGVGAGVVASLTKGSSNSKIVLSWGTAGTVGNGKSVSAVASGNNTPLSVTVSTSTILITLETDGSAASVSTVNDVIAKLYANSTFQANWDADDGDGDGTGVLAAFSSDVLASGTEGTEVFTTIAEITNISGPGIKMDLIDATHMQSPNAFREYIPSLLDGTEISFDLNYLPGDDNQGGLRADQLARAKRNFRVVWTDTDNSTDAFSGYVTDFTPTAKIDDKLSASATIKITGAIERL